MTGRNRHRGRPGGRAPSDGLAFRGLHHMAFRRFLAFSPRCTRKPLLAAALLVATGTMLRAQTPPAESRAAAGEQRAETAPELTARVDSLFARWDHPWSPGCALGVIRNGELVYTQGYGSSHLAYEVPIGSETVFYMASVSKQFVSAAVTLADEQGHLDLDDPVRKYVPELPDYGPTITIRHLIHHTSGLRDYLTLMRLAGRRYRDVHPREQTLALIARQRELNFTPGDRYLYSNTGYFLLALIIERATGQSLHEYAAEHIFRPLGMEDTHFHDDAYHVQKNRAISYRRGEDEREFRVSFLQNYDNVGSGGLYSTVEDMARWDRIFYGESPIGEANFIDTLHTRGVLNGGDTLDYAFGLDVGEYRGLRTVGHGGSMMGFKTALLRFPAQRFSVVCLCNLGEIEPTELVERVADIYLAEAFPQSFAYAEETEEAADEEDGPEDDTATDDEEPFTIPAGSRSAYSGSYYSEELDVTYTIELEADSLVVLLPLDDERTLEPAAEDLFEAGSWELRFRRNAAGRVVGFRLDAGRVQNLRFVRPR